MPDECFEALTFGELSVGDLFIFLPTPGDNEGHGGLKVTHNIFKKTEENVLARSGLPYRYPMGSAVNVHRNLTSNFQHSLAVLRLQ
ncbi:MAG TPA: hypothetical protein VJ579_04030 [Candidatus Paceibacterota bacterium]|nr:hypothetical protein [Candidatus Paceibacterota bacterium]